MLQLIYPLVTHCADNRKQEVSRSCVNESTLTVPLQACKKEKKEEKPPIRYKNVKLK